MPAPATFDRFGQEDECTKSDLDGEQICLCGAGRKISEVSAVYNSGKKDRKYLFKCTDIPGNVGGFSGDSWYVHYIQIKYTPIVELAGTGPKALRISPSSSCLKRLGLRIKSLFRKM